jgi:hypothetical protein
MNHCRGGACPRPFSHYPIEFRVGVNPAPTGFQTKYNTPIQTGHDGFSRDH